MEPKSSIYGTNQTQNICHTIVKYYSSKNWVVHNIECIKLRWICWHPLVPCSVSSITIWKIHYLWGLGLECIQPSFDISGKLCLSSSCIISSGSVQCSGRTCHGSIQTFDSCGTMLDGGSLASQSSQPIGRHSSALSCNKRPCHGSIDGPGTQGSAISVFNLLAAQKSVVWTRGLFLSLSNSGRGNFSIFNKGLPAMLERMGRLVCSRGCTKQCHICPQMSSFLVICLGLAWLGMQVVFTFLLFLPFWNLSFIKNLSIIL